MTMTMLMSGVAGYTSWSQSNAHVFHIGSNPVTLLPFEAFLIIPLSSAISIINSPSISSSADASSQLFPWECWTQQGIVLSRLLIMNKFPTELALLLRPHV